MKKKKLLDLLFDYFASIESNYPSNHFGIKPLASKDEYLDLFNHFKNINHKEIDDYENALGLKIDKQWIDNLALYTQIVIKKSDINYNHGRILYSTLKNYILVNKIESVNIIETGTARGFSSMCMSKAINDANCKGKIITFDILPHNKKMIWNIIDDTSPEGPKSRNEILSRWPKELSNIIFIQGSSRTHLLRTGIDRCHFAFLDAEHTKKDVLSEFDYISKIQESGDIIVFDDVTPDTFPGVVEAVDFIHKEANYNIKKIFSSNKRGYAVAKKV